MPPPGVRALSPSASSSSSSSESKNRRKIDCEDEDEDEAKVVKSPVQRFAPVRESHTPVRDSHNSPALDSDLQTPRMKQKLAATIILSAAVSDTALGHLHRHARSNLLRASAAHD